MKKLAIAIVGILGLLAAAAAFLLATAPGLRWTLGQVLSRTGAPVEIGQVDGRLIGPLSLENVSYKNPETGMAVQVDSIELDWRPGDLLSRVLHVTRARAAGIEYTPGRASGTSSADKETKVPEIALPLDVRVDRLEVESVSAAGTVVDRASLGGRLEDRSLSLSDISVSAPRYGIEDGRIQLKLAGDLPIQGSLSWHVEPEDMAALAGTLETGGALAGTLAPVVALHQPFAADAEGTITNLLDELRWKVTARLPDPVSLDRLSAQWPTVSLQGNVEAEGDTGQARLQPDMNVAYQDRQVAVTGNAVVTGRGLDIRSARITQPGTEAAIDVSGRAEWTEALPFSVKGRWQSLQGPEAAPWSSRQGEFDVSGNLEEIAANLSGVVSPPGQGEEESPIKVDVDARGLKGEPAVRGTVRLPYLHYGKITAQGLDADIDFNAAAGRDSSATVNARVLQYGKRAIDELALRASGSTASHRIELAGKYEAWSVDLRVDGGYSEGNWDGRVQAINASSGEAAWRLNEPAGLAWSSARGVNLERLCLTHAGARICAGGGFESADRWQAEAEASGVPLRWLAADAPAELKIDGALGARARVANQGNGIEGEATAKIPRAMVDWQGDSPVTTRYRDLALTASLDADALKARLDGAVENDGRITGELTTRDPLADDGALSGRVSARLPSLRLIQAFVPELGLEEGRAEIALEIDGTRTAPELKGDARVEEAVVEVDPLGIRLTGLNAALHGTPGGGLELNAQATSGQGNLEVTGKLEQRDDGDWQGEINLSGKDAELTSLPKALIHGSPDLHVAFEPSGGRVTGRLDITSATLTPDAGQPGVTLSDDIVVVDKENGAQPTPNPMDWHADVTIDLGQETRFTGYGLKARLTGALDLTAPPHQPTRANGAINIVDGEYSLYGRTFKIERGRLIYAGGPVDNPGIDLRVTREVNDTSVSLAVTGPLTDPDLNLSSTKPMSDTDKMSYLLLGRPASEASSAEAGVLLQAAASLIPGGGVKNLPGKLRSTLGLDTVEVRNEGTAEGEGAAVVLGKYLSPRLYVSYIAGFQQTLDMFRVRYELTRHWMLRAESSTRESGGDLLFTW